MKIMIVQSVIDDILLFAKNAAPNEAMVLLGGTISTKELQVTHLVYQHVSADEHTAIITHGHATENIVGSCHSHPGHTNPSEADKKYFNKNPGIHLIIGKPYTAKNIKAFNHFGEMIEFAVSG